MRRRWYQLHPPQQRFGERRRGQTVCPQLVREGDTAKVDLKKELRQLYAPCLGRMELVGVPELTFLMVDGRGAPGLGEEFREAISALYSTAYTPKFMLKGRLDGGPPDFVVTPLEGLWTDLSQDDSRSGWEWTLMLLQPDFVTQALVEEARKGAAQEGVAQPRAPRSRRVL